MKLTSTGFYLLAGSKQRESSQIRGRDKPGGCASGALCRIPPQWKGVCRRIEFKDLPHLRVSFIGWHSVISKGFGVKVEKWINSIVPFLVRTTQRTNQRYCSSAPSITRAPFTAWPGRRRETSWRPARTTRRWSWWSTMTCRNSWRDVKSNWRCTMERFGTCASSRTARTRRVCWSVAVLVIARFTWQTARHLRRSKRSADTGDTFCRCTTGEALCSSPVRRWDRGGLLSKRICSELDFPFMKPPG